MQAEAERRADEASAELIRVGVLRDPGAGPPGSAAVVPGGEAGDEGDAEDQRWMLEGIGPTAGTARDGTGPYMTR